MKTDSIEIPIHISDESIERLERIKQLLREIKEIDNNFNLSNVINVDRDSILVVTTDEFYCKKHIDAIENDLRKRIGLKCVLMPKDTEISKAINFGIDNAKERDYTTTIYYDIYGNIIKEDTIQYK